MTTFLISLALIFLAVVLFGRAAERRNVSRQGLASFMGAESEGKTMANGQPFRRHRLTCASWHYPLGTLLLVSHKDYTVMVEVTDRGPAKRLGREIDLSETAFGTLAPLNKGLIIVTITPIL